MEMAPSAFASFSSSTPRRTATRRATCSCTPAHTRQLLKETVS